MAILIRRFFVGQGREIADQVVRAHRRLEVAEGVVRVGLMQAARLLDDGREVGVHVLRLLLEDPDQVARGGWVNGV